MALTKVLITVKTYPTLSTKYDELVCTAGFREDGTWVRLYPVPFRKKSYNEQYKKYDWIEVDLVKNTSDFRPDSFRPRSIDSEIKVVGHIDTANNWNERKKICLNKIYYKKVTKYSRFHNSLTQISSKSTNKNSQTTNTKKNQKKMKILRILAFIALLGFCSAHVNVLQFFKYDKLAEV